MIAVGRCPNSPGILFYNPENGTFISSIDYKFQNHITSGAFFGLKYQSGTFIYRLDEENTIFTPKFQLDATVLVHTHSPPHQATIIGLPTYDRPQIYTVSFSVGSIAEYSDNVLELSRSFQMYHLLNFCHIGLRRVRLLRYFYITCLSLDMVDWSRIQL
jgi:hypothetical protein